MSTTRATLVAIVLEVGGTLPACVSDSTSDTLSFRI